MFGNKDFQVALKKYLFMYLLEQIQLYAAFPQLIYTLYNNTQPSFLNG